MRRTCLLALALGLLAAPAGAQTDLSGARMITLHNGLRVLLAPDSTATAVDVAAWSDAGTRTEPAGRAGITYLLEHLLAQDPGVIARLREVEDMGGVGASFTTPDVSGFSVTLPPAGLETALALQAARLSAADPAPAAIAAGREAMRAERPGRPESSPNGRGLRRLFGLLDPGLRYAEPITGSDEDLARITPKDCAETLRARFAPATTLLTVVGRFDPGAALRQLASTVERVPRRGIRAPAPSRSPAGAGGRAHEPVDFQLPIVFVGWRAPAASSADAAALDLLSRLLTTGASSRLARALLTPEHGGLFVQGGYDARRDGGVFFAAVAVAPGADSTRLENDLIAEVRKLVATPVSDEELESARRQAESNLLFGWQTSWGRAQALGTAEMVAGDWHAAWRLAAWRRLTPADLQKAAAAVLGPPPAVVWLTPAADLAGGAR